MEKETKKTKKKPQGKRTENKEKPQKRSIKFTKNH